MCRHVPPAFDAEAAEAAELAKSATVAQLRRVLGSYPSADEGEADPTEPKEPETPAEPRNVSFGTTERGTWQLSAELPADVAARRLGIWSHPAGERLEPWWVHLNERAG